MVLQIPEYGEEQLVDVRADEVEGSSRAIPKYEDRREAEVAEHEVAEEETHHPALENHEDHRPGAICGHCGAVMTQDDDVRLTENGSWVHEDCP
jgi:hypothetical protein